MTLRNTLKGIAGEYYVAAELSKRGHIALITLKNTLGVDILCSNIDSSRSVEIQVKTKSKSMKQWMLGQKADKHIANDLFYVFVDLYEKDKLPDFYVIPSKTVAKYVKKRHDTWLKAKGKKGQQHKDTPLRRFPPIKEYLSRWDLLGL